MLRFIKIDSILSPIDILPLEFMGSTLRGSFGVALKKVSCINPSFECLNCFAQKSCLFYHFFEVKNTYHSYRFSKALSDKNFNFSFYLFEDTCEKLPYILSAMQEMLTKQGLGIKKNLFHIQTITCNGINVYNGGRFDISAVTPKVFEIDHYESNAKVCFSTPFRIKLYNKLLYSKPSLEQILISISNRIHGIKGEISEKLSFIPEYKEVDNHIYFHNLTRYSNRQQTKMQIGGIMGYIDYINLDNRSYQLLKLGEIIGIGKQTTFGLGEIKIIDKELKECNE